MYRLIYRRQARNYLARLPLKIKSRIIDKLHELQKDPDSTNIDVDKNQRAKRDIASESGRTELYIRGIVISSSLKWSKYEREEISIRGRYGISNNKRKRQSKIRGSAG